MKYIAILICILMLTACAGSRGFDRGALAKQVHGDKQVVTDEEIQKTLDLKPQITVPFRLAVYLKSPYYYWHRYGTTPKWTSEEKDAIIAWGETLKKNGVLSDLFIIPDSSLTDSKSDDVKSIRLAAARHGADTVLIINTASDVDRYNNFASFFYIFLVPAYFVPGTHSDALFVMSGVLWDVRNQYLYLSLEAEGIGKKMGAAFTLEDKEAVVLAKKQALKSFGEEFVKRVNNLGGKK